MTTFANALHGALTHVGPRQPGFQAADWHKGKSTSAYRGDLTGTC